MVRRITPTQKLLFLLENKYLLDLSGDKACRLGIEQLGDYGIDQIYGWAKSAANLKHHDRLGVYQDRGCAWTEWLGIALVKAGFIIKPVVAPEDIRTHIDESGFVSAWGYPIVHFGKEVYYYPLPVLIDGINQAYEKFRRRGRVTRRAA